MKLTTTFNATLVAIEENKTSDGKNSYYKLAIVQGTEVANFSCSKEVYEARPQPFKNYNFELSIGEYEGKTTFRVSRIFEIPVSSSARPSGTTPVAK